MVIIPVCANILFIIAIVTKVILFFILYVLFLFQAQNAQQLHERIQSSSMDAKLEALKDLANYSRDVTFAQEFINLDGISLLTQMVESGTE